MENRIKTSSKTRRFRPIPSKPVPSKPNGVVSTALKPFPSFPRALALGAALFLGSYLVLTHQTLKQTFAGLTLWAVAVYLSMAWFPDVPGAGIFPMSRTPEAKENQGWGVWK